MNDFHRVYKNGEEVLPDLPFTSVYSLLEKHSLHFPTKEALVFLDIDTGDKQCFTYKELFLHVLRLNALLQKTYHLKEGDTIALHLSNSPFLLIFHLAAWISGYVTVPLDLKRDTHERKLYKLSISNAQLLAGNGGDEEKALAGQFPSLPIITEKDLINAPDPSSPLITALTKKALILFTSGTTAHPKGVSLSARNIFLNADGIANWLRITHDDRFFIVLPLHHINSTTMSMATLMRGGTVVLASRYTKSGFFRLMAENRCTLSSIVPTICLDLLSEQEQFRSYQDSLTQVSRIQIGSAPVVKSDVQKFIELYRIPLVQGYGSTETALRVAGVSPWGILNPLYHELVSINTIGSELTWNNLTVLTKAGQEAEEGEEGELCVRGPVVTEGYLADEKTTQESFYDGWFHTGDVGYWKRINSVKQYFINGRAKEIIIKGGINISPLSVEDALLKAFPEIKTCFVVGAQDKRLGEDIAALIVFHDTTPLERKLVIMDAISNAQKKEILGLSPYEVPGIVFETNEHLLPKTSTGKVQRVIIKKYIHQILNPLAENTTYLFRQLTPFDDSFFHDALILYNTRWGKDLSITEETLRQAVENGIVLAEIEKATDTITGLLLALKIPKNDLENKALWLQTYDQATGNLTLNTHQPHADSLLLVSIATKGEGYILPDISNYDQLQKSDSSLREYLPQDPVIMFHRKPKAGMEQGASVFQIIPGGRPEDKAALGYSIIMKYPPLHGVPIVNETATPGTQLLEAAFVFAHREGIHTIYAYSRPAGYLSFLNKISTLS